VLHGKLDDIEKLICIAAYSKTPTIFIAQAQRDIQSYLTKPHENQYVIAQMDELVSEKANQCLLSSLLTNAN